MLYDHILAIGTTGMLSGATYDLALKTNRLTCVARTTRSLKLIEGGLDRHGPTFTPIQADYEHPEPFMAQIKKIGSRRPFDLVIAWMHNTGKESLHQLFDYLSQQSIETHFYQLVGSAAADPLKPTEMLVPPLNSQLHYHQIILGFQITNGRSRWLNHGEISRGTLEAIKTQAQQTVIGTVEPWDARP